MTLLSSDDASIATSWRVLACHSEFLNINCMMRVHAGESENRMKLFGVYGNEGKLESRSY